MLARTVAALGAAVASVAVLLTIGSVWLALADPIGVAGAVGDRGAQGFVEALAQVVVQALRWAVRCL